MNASAKSLQLAGFTLLEVLVALSILALISTALFRQFEFSTRQVSQLEKEVLAQMLIQNRLAEFRLGLGTESDPYINTEFANRLWKVDFEQLPPEEDNQDFNSVLVKAYLLPESDNAITSLVGYVPN